MSDDNDRPKFDFENDVAIDLDNLHEEWAKHAQIRKSYADEVAYLEMVVKQQKKLIENKSAKLKEVTGKLILEIKKLDTKMTVQQVDATVAGHEQIQPEIDDLSDSQDKLIVIEYDLNMAKNALKSIDIKGTSLENEVSLWKGNYFATPREQRDVEPGKIKVTDKIEGQKTEQHREGINRQKRRARK